MDQPHNHTIIGLDFHNLVSIPVSDGEYYELLQLENKTSQSYIPVHYVRNVSCYCYADADHVTLRDGKKYVDPNARNDGDGWVMLVTFLGFLAAISLIRA